MRHHGRVGEIASKSDMSPVTAGRPRSRRVPVHGLEKAFPDIPVVTEERAATHAAGFAGTRFFLVDPIDGTKEFVAERGEFTINIGLIENGAPVAGAVYAPAVDGCLLARPGWAPSRPRSPIRRAARLPAAKPDNDGLIVVASRSH